MKTKKKNARLIYLLVVFILLVSLISPIGTFCADNNTLAFIDKIDTSVQDELKEIDFKELDQLITEFNLNNTNIFSITNVKEKTYEILSGQSAINYSTLAGSLFSSIIKKIVSYLPILSIIIAIGIVSNLLNGIKSKFNEKSTGDLIHIVCFMAVAILIIGMVTSLSATTGKTIGLIVDMMNKLCPIILTLMIGLGANVSASTFQPIIAIMSTYIADIFNYFIMPLFTINFVFGLMSNLSNSIKLEKFKGFIYGLFKWSVGFVFTLFFAVITLQGISAGSFDSIGIRTTKFTIKSYVPIMGGYLSDGMDLIMSSTLLIKNSLGLVGSLIIIMAILSPILDIAIFSLMLKLASAILEPLGDNKTSNFLSSTSKSVTMLSTCLLAIGFMYILMMGLVMTTANVVI